MMRHFQNSKKKLYFKMLPIEGDEANLSIGNKKIKKIIKYPTPYMEKEAFIFTFGIKVLVLTTSLGVLRRISTI